MSLAPAAKASAANLKLLHPDWEYRYFDDSDIRNFLRTECPEHEAAFNAFSRAIQRIDFFRYLAVYRLGGFYFDLDVFLSEPLDDLLGHGCVFPFEELSLNRHLRREHGMDWEIGNYGFGSVAGHPFLESVIGNCVRCQQEPEWMEPMMSGIPRPFRAEFEVLNTTGPGLLSRTLAEASDSISGMHVLFPENVLDKSEWHLFGRYGVHLMNGTWRSRGGFAQRRLMRVWESWLRRRLLPESIRAGSRRTLRRTCPRVPASTGGFV